jgi:DNA-directed RNA polymerase specialized sigma24 family protein
MNTENLDVKIDIAMKDKDIVNIMNKACSLFYRQLDSDTLYTCKINALWKSLLNYDENKNTKFTTYLYKGVLIECLKAAKFEKKSKDLHNKMLHVNVAGKDNPIHIIDILDELKTQEEKDLILDKLANMTIQEMADKRNYSRETVRKKLKKIFAHLQNRLS